MTSKYICVYIYKYTDAWVYFYFFLMNDAWVYWLKRILGVVPMSLLHLLSESTEYRHAGSMTHPRTYKLAGFACTIHAHVTPISN